MASKEILRDVPGVIDTEVGFAGCVSMENTTYQDTNCIRQQVATAADNLGCEPRKAKLIR